MARLHQVEELRIGAQGETILLILRFYPNWRKPGCPGRVEKLATCSLRQSAGAATWYPLCQCAGWMLFSSLFLTWQYAAWIVPMSQFLTLVSSADCCKLRRESGLDSSQRLWVDTAGAGGGETRGGTTWYKGGRGTLVWNIKGGKRWDNLI